MLIQVPVAFELAIDRRRMATQRIRDLPNRLSGGHQLINIPALVQTQMLIAVHIVPSWKGDQTLINPGISHFDLESTLLQDLSSITEIMLIAAPQLSM